MSTEIGLNITEQQYRKLNYPSYSLLSGISKKDAEAMNGERIDISDLDPIIIGSIVDSVITEGQFPDTLTVVAKKPSGKALDVIKEMVVRDDLAPNKPVISENNKKILHEICDKHDYYSKSISTRFTVLKKYTKYIKALQEHGNDALIASKYQYDEAVSLINALLLRFPFLKEEDKIIPQVKIIGEVDNVEIKGMLDFIYVDDEEKKIYPYDLKTGAGVHHEFFEKGYLGWRYYIQSSLYKELLEQNLNKHPKYHSYKVMNFRFMFCGRKDKLPIIYEVSDKQHIAGFTGFTYKGIDFPGIHELIQDYLYYKARPNAVYKRGFGEDVVKFDDSYL